MKARLADALILGVADIHPHLVPDSNPAMIAELGSSIAEVMAVADLVTVDEVAQFAWASGTLEPFSDFERIFDPSLPPWQIAWIEYRISRFEQMAFGALLETEERDDGGYLTHISLFGEMNPQMPVLMFNGRLLTSPEGSFEDLELHHPDGADDDTFTFFQSLVVPILLACTLSYAKGVEIVVRKVDEKLRRARERRGKRVLRWHTVNIEPLRAVAASSGGGGKGLAKALHKVRRHRADYSKGKGLFGKYKRVFWFKPHWRGDASRGVSLKDYRVRRPLELSSEPTEPDDGDANASEATASS